MGKLIELQPGVSVDADTVVSVGLMQQSKDGPWSVLVSVLPPNTWQIPCDVNETATIATCREITAKVNAARTPPAATQQPDEHKHTHWHLPPGYVVTAVGDTLRIEPAAAAAWVSLSRPGDITVGAGPQGSDTVSSFSPDMFGPDNKP